MNPPTPEERAANTAYLTKWGKAVAKAELATVQASAVAQGGRPGSIDYSNDGREYGDNSSSAIGGGPGYSPSQLQEIADAPVVSNAGSYLTPACASVDDNSKVCPPMASNPPWGNSGVSFPGPKPCKSGVVGWIEKNPWYFIALVVAGGFALDSLMDESK